MTKETFLPLLRFYRFRYWFVRSRYAFLKKKMRFADHSNPQIMSDAVEHNLSAFHNLRAAFGCGNRMEGMLFPVIAYYTKDRPKVKSLIVGCRTEDDIYWLRSHGFTDTYGFDLFSYSSNILIGDIHKTDFPDNTYDVILLGWMIAYSTDPKAALRECVRILKPGGLLGVSLEHVPGGGGKRANPLNSTGDIIKALDSVTKHKVVFEFDHYVKGDSRCVLITRLSK